MGIKIILGGVIVGGGLLVGAACGQEATGATGGNYSESMTEDYRQCLLDNKTALRLYTNAKVALGGGDPKLRQAAFRMVENKDIFHRYYRAFEKSAPGAIEMALIECELID